MHRGIFFCIQLGVAGVFDTSRYMLDTHVLLRLQRPPLLSHQHVNDYSDPH